MHVTLANPRGFCAGVDRAIDIVNRALEVFGTPVYVRHEVVHNKKVVDDLKARGVPFLWMNSMKSRMTPLSFSLPMGCPSGPGRGCAASTEKYLTQPVLW